MDMYQLSHAISWRDLHIKSFNLWVCRRSRIYLGVYFYRLSRYFICGKLLDSNFLSVSPQPESMSEQIQLFAEILSDGWMIAKFTLPHSDTVKPA